MLNQQLIHSMVEEEEMLVPTLFKPVQFSILRKLDKGKQLTENEKRYARGNMREKIIALQGLVSKKYMQDEEGTLLNSIGSYYITGLAALKHNGYGWYFEPKRREIINTKIEGTVALSNKTFTFIRVKSIAKSSITIDKHTGLKFATNEQILKDIASTKNTYTEKVWMQMLERYKYIFVKDFKRFKERLPKQKKIDYAAYGV